jgi:hypothetical protein
MADSQQVHGGGSTRAGEQSTRRGGQPGGQRAGQAGGQAGGQAPHVAPDHDNHGQSPAAWTAVAVVMVGALVMAIAVVVGSVWLFVVGAVVAVLGGISGKVLSAMGFGKSGRPGH